MAERSRDWSSSAESHPEFPGCSYFRRRNDNHLRCQQCRLNGNHFVLKTDPVSFARIGCLRRGLRKPRPTLRRHDARPQRRRRQPRKKASEETMDDSVEIHAPEEALQLPSKRSKSEGLSKMKRTKTKATSSESSQPKSVASSVLALGRPSSQGSDRRRSRSPECKRRYGDDKRQDSPRH